MNVKDCMTKRVDRFEPDTPIGTIARTMEKDDIGAVLVNDGDRLVGVVTDRDIVIRGLADQIGPDDPVSKVMSKKVLYCYEDDSIEDVAKNMAKNQVHRLAVLNKDKRLVGIVSLGDLSTKGDEAIAAHALCEICKPTRH